MNRWRNKISWFTVCLLMVMQFTVVSAQTSPRSIPTTSNPSATGEAGVRTMANTSFENVTSTCTVGVNQWVYLRESALNGWFTSHAPWQEYCNSGSAFGINTARVIELNRGTTAPDGIQYASLNADHASFLYQKLCISSGESFDFSFWHNGTPNETHSISFRFGIPAKATAGTLPADSYSREIIRIGTQVSATNFVATAANVIQKSDDTTAVTNQLLSPPSASTKWGVYAGTHTLPVSDWDGVFNVGFEGIFPTTGYGNLLDKIELVSSQAGVSLSVLMGVSQGLLSLSSKRKRALPSAILTLHWELRMPAHTARLRSHIRRAVIFG
jgi:hypothetical protein